MPIAYATIDNPEEAAILAAQAAAYAAGVAHAVGSGVVPALSWTQPTWFIDPANVTGLASDTNDGQTVSTPFLTYARLLQTWGTQEPILDIDVVVTFLSGASNPDEDPIRFSGSGAGSITFQGPPLNAMPLVAEVTIISWAARDRSTTPVIQNFEDTWGAAPYQYVVNTIRDNSCAFVYKTAAGAAVLSQPMAAANPPPNPSTPNLEDNTWANGDICNVYAFPVVHVLNASFASSGPTSKGCYFYHLNLCAANRPCTLGDFVRVVECSAQGLILVGSELSNAVEFLNCAVFSASGGTLTSTIQQVYLRGGWFGVTSLAGVSIDDDTILAGSFHTLLGSSFALNVCLDMGGGTGLLVQASAFLDHRQSGLPAPPVLWGQGLVYVSFSALAYTEPATTAFTNANGAGLRIGTNATAFAVQVTSGVASLLGSGTTGRNLTAANLDADIGSGGFHVSAVGATAVGRFSDGVISSVGF